MSAVSEKTFCIDEYPEYYPVIYTVIRFFLRELEKMGKHIRPAEGVDYTISLLFGINGSYASDFRKLFFPNKKCKEDGSLRNKCFGQYKISHFNYKMMVSECERHHIYLSDEMREVILLLSTYALPVSEILKEKKRFEIHKQLEREAKQWIKEIDAVMECTPDLKARIFMYLHQFRANEFTWWLLATLPSIDEEKIAHWIDELNDIPSEKTSRELLFPPKRLAALLELYEKFPRLNASNLKTAYNHITVFDLQCAYFHIDFLKQLSHTPLRRDDVYLSYLMLATLKEWPQDLMLEQIAAASKATLPVKYGSLPDEIEGYWALPRIDFKDSRTFTPLE